MNQGLTGFSDGAMSSSKKPGDKVTVLNILEIMSLHDRVSLRI